MRFLQDITQFTEHNDLGEKISQIFKMRYGRELNIKTLILSDAIDLPLISTSGGSKTLLEVMSMRLFYDCFKMGQSIYVNETLTLFDSELNEYEAEFLSDVLASFVAEYNSDVLASFVAEYKTSNSEKDYDDEDII